MLSLPNEIWWQIEKSLDNRSKLNLSLCSHEFFDYFDDQFKIRQKEYKYIIDKLNIFMNPSDNIYEIELRELFIPIETIIPVYKKNRPDVIIGWIYRGKDCWDKAYWGGFVPVDNLANSIKINCSGFTGDIFDMFYEIMTQCVNSKEKSLIETMYFDGLKVHQQKHSINFHHGNLWEDGYVSQEMITFEVEFIAYIVEKYQCEFIDHSNKSMIEESNNVDWDDPLDYFDYLYTQNNCSDDDD